MSARVKYGSAFSPVILSKSALNHPFSIKNLLNLSDQIGADAAKAKGNKANYDLPYASSTPRKSDLPITRPVTAAANLNVTENNSLWPAWVYATRYSRHGIPPANYSNPRRPRKAIKRQKQRPLFSPEQLQKLEEEFVTEKYISKSRRCKLASEIRLTEAQVRTWFQNRRTRWRKEVHEEEEDPSWNTRSGIEHTGVTNCMIVRGYCSV